MLFINEDREIIFHMLHIRWQFLTLYDMFDIASVVRFRFLLLFSVPGTRFSNNGTLNYDWSYLLIKNDNIETLNCDWLGIF